MDSSWYYCDSCSCGSCNSGRRITVGIWCIFIALYREGLSGWLFGLGFFCCGFLVSLAINPLYVVSGILIITGLLIFFNYYKISWNIISIASIVGSVLVLSGLALASPKILEKLPKHQRERIEVLYKGERMFRDTSGYNLLYSKTAIGSGGLWGKGYKEGSVTQGKFVPEQQTDYIFCTVGEEWGFIGSATLIICYVLYIGRIYYLAEKQKSTFNRVLATALPLYYFYTFVSI